MDLIMRFGMFLAAIMIEPSLQTMTKIPVLHNYEMAEICELPCNSYTGRYWTVAKKCFPCQEGTRLVCMDNKKFCAPYEVCEAGTMKRVVYNNKTDTVSLVKDECPHSYYQPVPKECLDSCQIHHSHIPPNVIIYKQQTSTAPAVGYCDFQNGFISLHKGWTFFNLSQPFHCYPASEHTNLCKPNEIIFNNMSCLTPCALGSFHVDEDRYFHCNYTGNHSSPGYIPEINTTESSGNGEVSTKSNEITKEPDKNSSGDDFIMAIIILLTIIGIAVFIGLAIMVSKACEWRLLHKSETINNHIYNGSEVTYMNGKNVTCTINNKESDETAALNGNSSITSV